MRKILALLLVVVLLVGLVACSTPKGAMIKLPRTSRKRHRLTHRMSRMTRRMLMSRMPMSRMPMKHLSLPGRRFTAMLWLLIRNLSTPAWLTEYRLLPFATIFMAAFILMM